MIKQKFTNDDDGSDDEKIILDRAAFRALASDTRVEILKELDKRRKTLTEISDGVGLAVATVKEHMTSLSASGLVEMKDEGRKWKYYNLTSKGKAILYPERRKIWVVIAALMFTLVLSSYMTIFDIGYLGGAEPAQPAMLPMHARIAESSSTRAIDYSNDSITDSELEILHNIGENMDGDFGVLVDSEDVNSFDLVAHDDSELDSFDTYEEITNDKNDVLSLGSKILKFPMLRYFSYILLLFMVIRLSYILVVYSRNKNKNKRK